MSEGPVKTVVALARDLLFSSRIDATARGLGYRFRAARSIEALRVALAERPGLLLVDLAAQGLDLDAAFRAAGEASPAMPVLGWTTHALWKATKPLHGRCTRVVTRETLTEELPDILRGYLAEGAPVAPRGSR